MKSLFFLLCVSTISMVLANPRYVHPRYQNARLLHSDSVNNEDGHYRWSYSVSDGTTNQQKGYVKYPGGKRVQAVEGSWSYISPEGIPIRMSYRADEGGFQAFYDNVPQSPPLPKEIQESLAIQYKAAQEQLSRAGSPLSADTFFPQLTNRQQRPFTTFNNPNFNLPGKRESEHTNYVPYGTNHINTIKLPSFPIVEVNGGGSKTGNRVSQSLQLPLVTPVSVVTINDRDYERVRVVNPHRGNHVRRTVVRRRFNPNRIRTSERETPQYHRNDQFFLSSKPFDNYNFDF